MNTVTLRDETPPGTDLRELVARARAAYEQKRTKECIELTKQVLLADAENAEGKALHAAVLSDIQRDLTDARALLEDARKMADGQKYQKAAEIILLKILYLDPSHADAKALLAASKSTAPLPRPQQTPSKPTEPVSRSAETSWKPATKPGRREEEQLAFTAAPEPVQTEEYVSRGMNLKVPLIAAAVVLLAGGLWFLRSYMTVPSAESQTPAVAVHNTKPLNAANTTVPAFKPAVAPPVIEVKATNNEAKAANNEVKAASNVPAVAPPPTQPAVQPVANVPPKPAVKEKEMGSLAINSPTAADIYLDDKYLGSTPITLQLPAGRQTLEYRHGDLRTSITHEVKARETTPAFVTFEITVQLNARPWAQVYVEGSTRRALGQTPLSSVRVPIGSTLTFENPNFPAKSHRVTESDNAIQMVFP